MRNSPDTTDGTNTPKELSETRKTYLRKQVYYFFPFLRKYYEVLRKMDPSENGFKTASLQDAKGILFYYANAFVFGEFDMTQEQTRVDTLFATIDQQMSREELKKRFLGVYDGTGIAKSDGYT